MVLGDFEEAMRTRGMEEPPIWKNCYSAPGLYFVAPTIHHPKDDRQEDDKLRFFKLQIGEEFYRDSNHLPRYRYRKISNSLAMVNNRLIEIDENDLIMKPAHEAYLALEGL
jgi:hypothetical protein